MNKFKILKSTLALAASFALFIPFVSADEQEYYTNQNGVVMPMEDYEYLVKNTSEMDVELLNQENYELLMEDISNFSVVESSKKYYITSTFRGADGEVLNYEEEVSEEEYNEFEPISPYSYCSSGLVCWETNAKIFLMTLHQVGSNYTITSETVWKTIPVVRSYDVSAIRWESSGGTFVPQTWLAREDYNYEHFYAFNDQFKVLSNGIGVSANLGLQPYLTTSPGVNFSISGYFTGKTITSFYGTYQHATTSVTLAQSKSYTLNANGLGGSLYYSNATIRNSYDNMTGLYFTINDYV